MNNTHCKAGRPRKTDKDVYFADKLKTADFNTGFFQIPAIPYFNVEKPHAVVLWSERKKCKEKHRCALLFYEFDCRFDGKRGIYNILKYGSQTQVESLISEIKDFSFVVCPDYSVFGDFPNYKQIDALARSREVGYILSTYGIKVVVNFRATYEWTYELALEGIPRGGVIAIGTLGALRDKESRKLLDNSINALLKRVSLKAVLVYGSAPGGMLDKFAEAGVEVWHFNSRIGDFYTNKKQAN